MSLSFEPINTENAPRSWQEVVTSTHTAAMYVAHNGLQAVMRAVGSSGQNFSKTKLLMPSADKRGLVLDPAFRELRLSAQELRLLGAGAALLVFAQGVSRLLEHATTTDIDRTDNQGSIFRRMPVPYKSQARCAKKIDEEGIVTDFSVRWQPRADGGLNRAIAARAILVGGSVDSIMAEVDVSSRDGLTVITARAGDTVEGFPNLQEAHFEAVRNMGQSLVAATNAA